MTSQSRLPYPGLRAFTREESDLFFGRESCVDSMVDRLAETRFLAVLGPSGSGKSSLVRTGLLDALDLGFHTSAGSNWQVADLHPGGQPLRNLAAALLGVNGATPQAQAMDIDLLVTFLSQGPRSVAEWALGGNLQAGSNLLILVDQFEELFRYGGYAQREEAEAFVALLLESAATPEASIHIVITMRSEYLGACTLVPGLAESVSSGLYLTPRMSREECREAIIGPAGVVGFNVTPALINRLLNDLASFAPWDAGQTASQLEQLSRRADQLPLMQHVLNRLWARGAKEVGRAALELGLGDYEQIGGLSGALDGHGAEVITTLHADQARHVEEIFRALVSGTSLALAVRRPCSLGELVEVTGGARDDVVAVVAAFRAPDCNFLRTSKPSLDGDSVIVDISHESLIRQWTPLAQWLEKEARDDAAWRRLVSAQEHYSQGEGSLLTGLDLQSLKAWWEAANPKPAWAARHGAHFEDIQVFISASQQEAAVQATAQRRHEKRERYSLRFGVIALVIALAISLYALTKKKEEIDNAREAANALDSISDVLYGDEYNSLLGLEAMRSKMMETLITYQAKLAARHAGLVDSALIAQDKYRMGAAYEETGQATQAKELYREGYEGARKAIEAVPVGLPAPKLVAAFVDIGNTYAWSLLDIDKDEDGSKVLQTMERLVGRYDIQAMPQELLLPFTRFERLENRYYSGRPGDSDATSKAKMHLERALGLVSRAITTQPRVTMESLRLQFLVYVGKASYAKDTERIKFQDMACYVAGQMLKRQKLDTRAIAASIKCHRILASRARVGGKEHAASEQLQIAREEGKRFLDLDEHDQGLLLSMAEVETDDASLPSMNADEKRAHNVDAEKYLVRALKDRTSLDVLRIRDIYDSLRDTIFPIQVSQNSVEQVPGLLRALRQKLPHEKVRDEHQGGSLQDEVLEAGLSGTHENEQEAPIDKLTFYEHLYNAVEKTSRSLPEARSLTYVAADSASQIGQMLSEFPKRKEEAADYLSKSIGLINRPGTFSNASRFSEDFAAYCGVYATRIELSSVSGRVNVDLMLADIKAMAAKCLPVLERYPWDFYLRERLVESEARVGSALFELRRYAEALPYLEYASHWGKRSSSELLAQAYRDGLGIQTDQQKAQDVKALAEKQSMKRFTIPADFAGVKAPFYFYVLEWPPDYPFSGIDDQLKWLKEARGGTVDPVVGESLRKLHKIARDNKVSFPELCAYALATAKKSK